MGGAENSYPVAFNVTRSVVEPYTPEITSAEPRDLNQKFKKSDDEVTFSVSASGNGTISYRWKVDGTEVSTDSRITIVPEDMTVGDHTVKCTVSNTIENTSKLTEIEWKVVIEKSAEPEITSKESSATIDGTGSVDFKITADGDNLKYQWYMLSGSKKQAVEDGTYGIMEYSGATTDKLTIKCTMAPKNVSTKFVCEVANAEGLTATSGEYILNISEDPNAEKVQKIEVTTKPSKTDYIVGETFDQSGMKLTVTTGKGTEEITSGFVCSPLYLEEEGSQTITVSYGGKTTSFTVYVTEAPHEHEWSEWRVEGKDSLLRVVRDCTAGDDCTAQEILSKDSFMAQYPTIAHKLGLTEDNSNNKDTDKKDDSSDKDKNDTDKADDDKNTADNKGESKKSSNTVLWIIIIIAVILLAGVVYYYIKVYRKPYKKPNSGKVNNKKR